MTDNRKHALVTGGSQGLGKEIARHLIESGHSVCICGRHQGHLDDAVLDLSPICKDSQKILATVCDISSTDEVDRLFGFIHEKFGDIDVVVNNAGIHGAIGPFSSNDWEQWKTAISVNLLGTAYVCKLAVTHFQTRGDGKIINISGGGATSPMPGMSAYAASKAALVRFTETLALEVSEYGIEVNAVAPGALKTRLTDEVLASGPALVGQEYYDRIFEISQKGGTPLELAASLCSYLASDRKTGISGRLISAVWDPWEDFESLAGGINAGDIYTLRRIVPEDRGELWGEK